jgi:nicotinamidase-related amidase
MAGGLSAFAKNARPAAMPIIYVNDNFGLWRSSWPDVYAHCTRRGVRGAGVSKRLRPKRDDYFILKPRHSAFYSTSLVPLLEFLGVRRLILAGIATNLCVLFTAHDAHMRGYPLIVFSDCCAAESDFDHNIALKQLERFCNATICRSDEFRFRGKRRISRKAAKLKVASLRLRGFA